ncbi:hypothetical protein WMY93_007094 [Mugilogobius chulae]|uniref:Uncharacterized protein n=1 Tax=Mugilogobius chulae TaxID=88201 RepID=A0AAW0PX92_9GOBI
MSKNWEDYTPEDDESLYTEEFDLMKVLGLQEPQEVEQTSEGIVTTQHFHQASDTRPKDQDQQDLALVSSPSPVTSDASEAQTRDENLLKELMELRTLRNREREEFSRVILAHQTNEKDLLKELDQVKEESSRLTHLSDHQHQDEKVKLLRQMKQIIVAQRNELEKRTIAAQMVQRELEQAQDEVKQLKCDLSDQDIKHQDEKFELLNQTKQIIEAHKAERGKQNKCMQEVQNNLNCVTKDKRELTQETERLHSQLKSQGITIERLTKQLTEAEDEALQKSKHWDSAKQALLKEKKKLCPNWREMSEVVKTSDELRIKLHDQTEQNVLMEEQVNLKDQLVQKLKDEIHQSEVERHLQEKKNCAVEQELRKAENQRKLLEEENCVQTQELGKAEEQRHLLRMRTVRKNEN